MNRSQNNQNETVKITKKQSGVYSKQKIGVMLVNCLKKDGPQQRQQYINNMRKFFSTIQKSKLRRLIDQVCSINSTFQNYVKNLPNQALTLGQTLDFEQKYRRNSVINRSRNTLNNYAKIDTQALNIFEINSGYRLLYRKLLDYQFVQFQKSVKCLRQILSRQINKLSNQDQTYIGEKIVRNQNINVSKQLFSGQNQIGFVKNVKNVTRMKLASIDQLSKSFAQMI